MGFFRNMSWQARLYTYAGCVVFTSASYTMCVPFLPIYLLDLGAPEEHIELWSAAVFAVSFLIGGTMAPVWGRLADKNGQKTMAVRSSILLCLSYTVGGLVASPLQLLGMRVLQGFANGFLPAVLSMASSMAPKDKLGSSLGVIQSAQLVGTVSGPLIGGTLAHLFGIRASFLLAGAALFAVFIINIFMPSDKNAGNQTSAAHSSILSDLRYSFTEVSIRELLLLFFCFNAVMVAIQPILTLYVAELSGSLDNVEILSGIACSLPPFIGALTAPLWGAFGQRRGFFLAMASGFMGSSVFIFSQGFAPDVTVLLIESGFMGLFIVGIVPSLNAALSLATPAEFRGRGFGMMTLAGQYGAMVGPLISGGIAHFLNLSTQFMVSGTFLMVLGIYALRRHVQKKQARRVSLREKASDLKSAGSEEDA